MAEVHCSRANNNGRVRLNYEAAAITGHLSLARGVGRSDMDPSVTLAPPHTRITTDKADGSREDGEQHEGS